ncbi:MAG: ATP-binding protein [Firmicutes bacterium]|nr:ATP-binding protein [Bacillota bacterium]
MRIAVLSGKGGTGKTLVSVNLATIANSSTYIDCDVEEPNGHLFFKPKEIEKKNVSVKIPVIDDDKCIKCRKCIDFCKFNALAFVNNKVKVFEDICHSCGGCQLICPTKAITEKDKIVGEVQIGKFKDIDVYTGLLDTGKASGSPIIKKLLEENINNDKLTFIDCPPGSACIVMESIKDADYCVLVAEPSIFGAHNLKMVYELVTLFEKPFGVVLNKVVEGENPSEVFCIENNIKIIGKIPFDKKLGTINSNALIVVDEDEQYSQIFSTLLETILKEVEHETIINS